jgi:hypothetical protein
MMMMTTTMMAMTVVAIITKFAVASVNTFGLH